MNSLEIHLDQLPPCPVCNKGVMLPLYDYACKEGAGIAYLKAWACSNCENNRLLYQGEIQKKTLSEGRYK